VFFDDERFWCVFEKTEQLDVPMYIHPTFATNSVLEHYRGNYSDSVALAMSAFGWGRHTETGHHILRLFASGMFDRFANVNIIIGHMGEAARIQGSLG
jgi:predicted TIM-barrel fold metal-dependent hydrolase